MYALAIVPIVSWLAAVVGSIGMMFHRTRDRHWTWYLFHGHAFWTLDGFTEGAKRWRKLQLAGALGFAISVVALAALSTVAAQP